MIEINQNINSQNTVKRHNAEVSYPRDHNQPEMLVGQGFRYWMAGYQQKEFDYWALGWKFYTDQLGVETARPLIPALATFVQEVHSVAKRPIEVLKPGDLSAFCQDECQAIALVAACQKSLCPALEACAEALIGASELERVICASCCFANKLAEYDLLLGRGH